MRPQDASTTPIADRDSWETPTWLFNWLNLRYRFGIDLAASERNAKCPLYFSLSLDAFSVDWLDFARAQGAAPMGFLNPPYSDIDPWMVKAVEQAKRGFTTVMLVPADNGEDRYGAHVHGVASEY